MPALCATVCVTVPVAPVAAVFASAGKILPIPGIFCKAPLKKLPTDVRAFTMVFLAEVNIPFAKLTPLEIALLKAFHTGKFLNPVHSFPKNLPIPAIAPFKRFQALRPSHLIDFHTPAKIPFSNPQPFLIPHLINPQTLPPIHFIDFHSHPPITLRRLLPRLVFPNPSMPNNPASHAKRPLPCFLPSSDNCLDMSSASFATLPTTVLPFSSFTYFFFNLNHDSTITSILFLSLDFSADFNVGSIFCCFLLTPNIEELEIF